MPAYHFENARCSSWATPREEASSYPAFPRHSGHQCGRSVPSFPSEEGNQRRTTENIAFS